MDPEETRMKVSREQAAQNRERILDAATRLFRERGFEGIGVADTMKAAGLTHGGFYGHFSSKEDLIAQACARAFSRSHQRWSRRAGSTPDDPLSSILFDAQASRRSRHRLRSGRARVRHGPARARRTARRNGGIAFRFQLVVRTGSRQVRGGQAAEGHQHLREPGGRDDHGPRGRRSGALAGNPGRGTGVCFQVRRVNKRNAVVKESC